MLGTLRKFLPLLLITFAAMAVLGAIAVFKNTFHYPSMGISAPGDIDITFLLNGRRDKTNCETLAANVTNAILAVCPTCQIKENICLESLKPQHRRMLSAEPLDVPSARLPDGGVMTYYAPNPDIALTACQESERQVSSRMGTGRVVCYPPNTARPITSLQKKPLEGSSYILSLLFVVLGTLAFGSAFYLVARHEDLQARLSSLPRSAKRMIMLGLDVVLLASALWTALFIRYGMRWSEFDSLGLTLALALLVAIPVFIMAGLYRPVTRYLESQMSLTVVISVTAAALLLVGVLRLLGIKSLAPQDAIVYWLLALLYVGGSRVIAREYFRRPSGFTRTSDRAIIYGAGDAGAQLAMSLKGNAGLTSVAFVDDNPDLAGSLLYGIKVHPASRLPALVKELGIRQVLLAIPSASKKQKKDIFERIEHLGVRIRTIPRLSSLVEGRARINDIEDIGIEDLLGRDPVPPLPGLLVRCIEGKVVLVTGAGGSIGSELCRQILSLAPQKLVLLEQSEYALYAIYEELFRKKRQFAYSAEIVPLLASVTPRHLLRHVLTDHQVNTIYHAAAYKHVPLVETNPIEAIRNNVIGSVRAAEAAIAEHVETFVLVSTDKAVRPTSIMGASKRMAELIMQAIGSSGNTRFCMVRFGNVLESSGSVVPLFRKQIQEGGPLTVTHPEITRYFMTISEAAQLVLQAGSMATGGDVFVLDMGSPVKILDLARRMIHLSGLAIRDEEHPNGDIEIRFTGLRRGEKLYEELLVGNNATGTKHPLIMRAVEESMAWATLRPLLASLETACNEFNERQAISILSSVVPLSTPAESEEARTSSAKHDRSPALKVVS